MASPMPSVANALMQPTQGPGRFGPAAAPAPVGNLRLPPQGPPIANALVAPQMARPPVPPIVPPQAPPQITPAFAPHHVPPEEMISPRVPVPKVDFHPKHHQDLHDKVLGEHFDDPGAANAIRDTYSILRRSRPHLHPRHVLEAARDAWFANHHGFMTPQQAGAAVGHIAEMRHQAAGGKHPADEEEPNE